MKQKNWRKDDLALFVFYREKLKKISSVLKSSSVQENGRQSDGQQKQSVDREPSRSRHGDLAALHQNVIDHVDHAINTLDIRTDHSSTNVLPLGKVLWIFTNVFNIYNHKNIRFDSKKQKNQFHLLA